MTSTEFAARYRLLKNVATRGARSFLAQQVQLGRMVMVHYLDSVTVEQQSATLARLEALQPPARQKLLEIADVDGSPVAVTMFISSFVDFATWLDSVSPSVAPPPLPTATIEPFPAVPVPAAPTATSDFTSAFGKVDASSIGALPPVDAPTRPVEPPARPVDVPRPVKRSPQPAGEFTQIFGKVDDSTPNDAPRPSERPAEVAPPSPSFSAEPPSDGASFTAIFGALSSTPVNRVDLPPAMPTFAEPGVSERVMPPVAPVQEIEQTPVVMAPTEPAPGEFTQLFQRLSSMPAPAAAPTALGKPTDSSRPADAVPRADFAPVFAPPPASLPYQAAAPNAALPNAALPGGMPKPSAAVPPVPSWQAPMVPPNGGTPGGASMGNGGVMADASSAPSEFTRILGRVSFPNPAGAAAPAPLKVEAPASAPQPAPPAEEKKPVKSMLVPIIALGAVLLLTIGIVFYFVLK